MVAPHPAKAELAGLSNHDALLSSLPRPAWLINHSLCDDQWELRNIGAGERRREKIKINFNISIAPGQKLSDRRDGDCLNAKLFVIESLNRSMYSPISITKIIYDYALFARWRLSKGIEKNSTINAAWWRVLFSEMRQAGGLAELASTQEALESVLSEMRNGTRPIPFDPARRRLLTRTLCEQIGIAHVGNLTASQKALLEEFASARNLTFSRAWQGASETKDREGHSTARVRQFLRSLEVMWELRGSLPDAPVERPFDGEFTPHGLAENICSRGVGRTKTVSAEQVCYLVDHAIRWVMDYAPDIKTYTDELVRQLKSRPGADFRNYEISALHASGAIWHRRSDADIVGSPFPIAPVYRRGPETPSWETRLPLRSVLTAHLPAACLIVIAAFSARRHEELDSLKDGCIQFVDGDPVLETWIGKTKQGLGKIPVPSVVVQAIEVLSWISEGRRKRTGKDWLLTVDSLWPPGSEAGRESFDLAQILDRFAEFVKVPLNADLTRWSPLPHQFRRFFGIVYFNQYRFPNLAALSRHYRHNDPDMTRRYITESAHGAFLSDLEVARGSIGRRGGTRAQWLNDFQEESLAFRIERFTAVARGEEKMTGWGGQHLSGLIENVVAELIDELDLLSAADIPEESLNQVLREFAAEKRLEPNPAGHSLCKCTSNPTDLRAALCVGSGEGEPDTFLSAPNPTKAVDEVCSRCPHNCQTADTQPYWRELKERTSPAATCGFAPLLRALQDERHRMAAEHYKRCFGE